MTDKELRQKLAKLIIENPDARVIYEVEDDNIYDDTEVCLNQLQTVALREMAYTNVLGNDYTDPDNPLYLMKDKLDLMDFEDMENNKLKPCPFCGSENVKIFEYRGTSKFYVICKNCFTPVGIYDGKDEATKRWNTRAWIPPDDYADAKIGDIVECDGIKLKVVDASDYKYSDCGKNCYFDGDQRCALVCCNDREDGVPVFFQKEDDK